MTTTPRTAPSGASPISGARRASARTDYSPIWNLAPWQPPGATNASREDALWRIACEMREPTQIRSRRLDRELAHPRLAAGHSYFGQLVAHDVSRNDPLPTLNGGAMGPTNLRRRKLALELLYDAGPRQAPHLYESADPALLRVESRRSPIDGSVYHDLARDDGGRPLVADPRQGQNVILAQMHVALARANNAFVGALRLREPRADALEVHARARRWLVTCYQHVLVRDWLPHVLHAEVLTRIEEGLATAHTGERHASPLFGGAPAHVSAEFAFAAFRFAHSMVREQYRMRPEGYLYDMTPATESADWLERGGPFLMHAGRLPAAFAVDWRAFVDNDDVEPNRSRRIGPRVTWSLGNLPRTALEPPRRSMLPYVTLRAGCLLPTQVVSGPTAARALGLSVVEGAPDPLWCYVLTEAERQCDGETLGELGSTIVGETFLGLLLAEHDGCDLIRRPRWVPPLGERDARFTLHDLLVLGDRSAAWIAERVEGCAPSST